MKFVIRWQQPGRGEPAPAGRARSVQDVLHYPFPVVPRTAILGVGFAASGNVRVFPDGWSPALARFEPESLAARVKTLRWLAHAVLDKRISLPPLRGIVIAFVDETGGCLNPTDRNELEQVFGVPVFEQLRSPSGELLAAECSNRNGLHVVESLRNLGSALLGFEGIDHKPCPCGSFSPRLLRAARAMSASVGA